MERSVRSVQTSTSQASLIGSSAPQTAKAPSFKGFYKRKEEERSSKFVPKSNKACRNKKVDESVTINIGMMEYVDKFPKPIRGQSLPLKVLKSDVCFKILDAAISKRKVYAISTSIHL